MWRKAKKSTFEQMKRLTFILMFFLQYVSFSQVKGEIYKSFSENNPTEHLLTFINDSVVKLSNIRTHMSGQVILKGKFKKINDTIHISLSKLSAQDSMEVTKYKINYLTNTIIRIYINKTELIDVENKTVYVKNSIYSKNYYRKKSLSYFEGKKYIVDRGITNGYGTIDKMPKKNKNFYEALQKQIENPNNYKSTIFKGLTAYRKYGLIGINGVCITEKIKKKEKCHIFNPNPLLTPER